jgi:4'-phosphopantetheinyl transferase
MSFSRADKHAECEQLKEGSMTGSSLPISRGEIHLWIVSDPVVQNRPLLRQYSEWLSEEEVARWQRFHFEKHRHQYLVTRALVRWTLSSYIPSVHEAEWRFLTNEFGRPAVANMPGDAPHLKFNISHTDGLIVMAVGLEGELGVDVEHRYRSGHTVEIAEHFFSPNEVAQLHSLPPPLQRDRFFDLWTLKESYIKARGMGLSIPLDSFSFSFPDDTSITLQVDPAAGDRPGGWQFWQLSPSEMYKIAVAWRSDRPGSPASLQVARAIPGHSRMSSAPVIFRSSAVGRAGFDLIAAATERSS